MKHLSRLTARFIAVVLTVSLVLSAQMAYAVVKNLSIVDGQGNSLANTKVTIVFPNGTEVEEETDDDGMLYYNFPEDGNYTVKYPGGQMAVKVGGGLTTGQWVGAGLATATIIGVGVVASDSGAKSSSDSSSDSYSPPSDPGSGSGGSGSGGSGSTNPDPSICDPAVYNINSMLSGDDPGGHAQEDTFNGLWEVTCPTPGTNEANIRNAHGSGPDPAWTCSIDSGGNCDAFDAPCVWGGQNTDCSIEADFLPSGAMSGITIIGFDGSLSPGQPVFFDIDGVRQ